VDIIGVHQTHCASALAALINAAYRGNSGAGRWTSEFGLIAGDRISITAVTDIILSAQVRLFAIFDADDAPRACIAVTLSDSVAEIGTFAVRPEEQGRGLGSRLLHHAERYALKHAHTLRVCVVNHSGKLIDFYARRDYRLSDQPLPYPNHSLVGTPLVHGINLLVMEKLATKFNTI
jgi:GNAT superfamily N-acetyltransferase